MARLSCDDWSRHWSLDLEQPWSLLLLLVWNQHWRLQGLTLKLPEAVRVENALELGLHLLEELLPEDVEVGCTQPLAATAATATSTSAPSTTSPGIAIRDNLSERQLMESKNPVLGAKKQKCQAHNTRHGDQLPEPGIGD